MLQYGFQNQSNTYTNYPNANYTQTGYYPQNMYNQFYQNYPYMGNGVTQNPLMAVSNYRNVTNQIPIAMQHKDSQKDSYSNSKKSGENILAQIKQETPEKVTMKKTIIDQDLEVKLTEEEKIYYNSLFNKLNKNNIGKIGAVDAARLT